MLDILVLDKDMKSIPASRLSKFRHKPLWIDASGITREESDLLQDVFDLHPLTSEDLLNTNTRVKVEEFNNYLLCVFYGIEDNLELREVDFVLGQNYVITNHKDELQSVKQLKDDPVRLKKIFEKGPAFLFHRMLDTEVDNFDPVLETIDDEIEGIEEIATRQPKPEVLSKILALKRQLVHIKRVTFPQREKIGFLTKNDYPHMPKKVLPYMRDVYDHAIRVSDTIDNYREAIANTFDAYMSAVSNSMNEVMKVLSIIATIALPLTVISGIYGTNFDNLPGQHAYIGFWIMAFVMLLMAGSMLMFFKKKRWI